MGNQVDFDKLRKKRQRAVTIKRLVIVAAVAALMGFAVLLNSFLIEAGVTVRLSDMVESFGGSGYPVPVPGGIIRDVKSMGDDLAVLNDTNLLVYNNKGKVITNLQQMGDSTMLLTSSERLFTYDVGAKRYSIHSRSKPLLEKQSESSLQGGAMNERGDYALISSTAQYASQVLVFDSRFNQIYEWLTSDLVAFVSLSPKGGRMAAVSISTRGGEVYSVLNLFDFSMDTALRRVEIPGEMAAGVQYLEDGRISLISNKQYRIYTSEGVQENAFSLEDRRVVAVERRGKETLLLLQSEDKKSWDLVLLDTSCTSLASLRLNQRVRDMALGGKQVYVLTDTGITAYSKSFEEKGGLQGRGIVQIHYVKNKLYYLNKEEINTLE